MKKRQIVLVVYNVRSCHNVGSLLRSADGLGINQVYLSGYTPYPEAKNDSRLPHLRRRIANQIHKSALGAEDTITWSHNPEIDDLIKKLRADNFLIIALEQTSRAKALETFSSDQNIALIVGNEVNGLEPKILKIADVQLQIPMLGRKESFNVTVAAAIALYHLRWLA